MLVLGAKGFAKEILEVLLKSNPVEPIAFYDDVTPGLPPLLFNQYPIIQNPNDAVSFFKVSGNQFCLGLGNPYLRQKMAGIFTQLGGSLTSVISPDAHIGTHNVHIGKGACIMPGAVISNDSFIGDGAIVYFHSSITHDCTIGDFTEISPAAVVLGRCKVGSFTQIGSNATILPDITIGNHAVIAAGAVVTRNIPDYTMAAGVPAVIKKEIQH